MGVSSTTIVALLLPALAYAQIDREKVVTKYNVVRTSLINDTQTPLQVGNGDFAFNMDNTGMQVYAHADIYFDPKTD
ncbi:unnamed protein product [Clonostachys byssicola]|uniref:Uncharacterized protein n=1 Tax=Clonostachys byssicola TaxID=160290 RepID=A0A9N9URG8_9HYPO|nr:unnamed protein product [Clonostachys byssicola]